MFIIPETSENSFHARAALILKNWLIFCLFIFISFFFPGKVLIQENYELFECPLSWIMAKDEVEHWHENLSYG